MPKTPNPWQTPRVIFNLAVYRGLQRGIDQLADAIRPTLGPLPRLVLTTNARLDHPEMFDVIGPYGRLEIRSGHGQRLEREYVEGSYWDGPLFSPHMVSDAIRQRALLEEPAILVSNLEVREPSELIPLMEPAMGAGSR